MKMQRLISAAALVAATCFGSSAPAQTTVDGANKFAYGANIGWIDWQGDVAHGAVFTETVASGFIYSANIGWIFLGDGSPDFGANYSNTTAADSGVTVLAAVDPNFFVLSGFAYSANAGWINFDVAAQAGEAFQPRIDKKTGVMSGFAYGANIGWISLESPGIAFVQTGLIEEPKNAARLWMLYDGP